MVHRTFAAYMLAYVFVILFIVSCEIVVLFIASCEIVCQKIDSEKEKHQTCKYFTQSGKISARLAVMTLFKGRYLKLKTDV